jgi:4-diphosphocytidyl-2-C-methyl-D-erythritol kinase
VKQSSEVRVSAHAKINVRLKVLGRETSGFHALETILVRIGLADIITVRTGGDGRHLEVAGSEDLVRACGPSDRNLALRAANSYAEITGWPRAFTIHIDKTIPVGAGLGGGSADAAGVLRALNLMAPTPCSERDLLRIAASLGADVPFLVSDGCAALAWGRGDRMLVVPSLPEREVILLTPEFAVSTAEAYSWLDATRTGHPAVPLNVPLQALSDWEKLAEYAENDFETPVIAQHPEVAQMIAALSGEGALIARMSGSGSSVFGVFADAPKTFDTGRRRWIVRTTRTLRSVVRPERTD